MLDDIGHQTTVRDYIAVVVRRRTTALVVLGLCLAVAVASVASSDRLYRASATTLVRSTSSSSVFTGSGQSITEARRRISNEMSVIVGSEVRERVRADLGLLVLPPRAEAASSSTDDVVVVSVVSSDPDRAAQLANAYVEAYNAVKSEQAVADLARAVDELQSQITRLQGDIDDLDVLLSDPDLSAADRDLHEARRRELVAQQAVFQRSLDQRQVDANLVNRPAQLVEPAVAPAEPFQPAPVRTGMLALLAGLVLGIGAAIARDRLDQSIKVATDISKVGTTLPVLAQIPQSVGDGVHPIATLRSDDRELEDYRSLRTNMQFVAIDRAMKVVQITSAVPGEGKTTTAVNLALVLSQTDMKVLLVDADLRKPMVHEAFGLDASTGLVDVLIGSDLDGVVQRVAEGLDVLPSGRVPVNPSEMLSSRRMGEVVDSLRTRYDFVIVDSAPTLPVSDAAALSRHVDGVLVVLRAGSTSAADVRDSISRLDQVNAPLIGIVLNRVRRPAKSRYGYGYGYAHRDGATQKSKG